MTVRSTSSNRLVERVHEQYTLRVPLVIRPTRADDLAKLEWFGTYAHFRDLFRRTWQDHLAGQRLMLVADLHNFPVGQVWLDVSPSEYAYLYAFRVFEPFRGLGIGSKLMDAAHQLARDHGFRQVQLAVEKSNRGARKLYERQGYQIFTERVDVWNYTDHEGKVHWVQEDVYGMRKTL